MTTEETDEHEHIVIGGEVTLCQQPADDVSVAMFIDDADCPKCLAVARVLEDAR